VVVAEGEGLEDDDDDEDDEVPSAEVGDQIEPVVGNEAAVGVASTGACADEEEDDDVVADEEEEEEDDGMLTERRSSESIVGLLDEELESRDEESDGEGPADMA
jgi:hypothetical protein